MASSPAGSASGRDTRTQLFVGNLPYRVRWQDLKDLFRRAGTVLRADVALGPDNRSRGHGTVLLASQEDADRAIGMFQGWCWQGRVLEVRKDRVISGEEGLAAGVGSALPSPMGGAGFGAGIGNGLASPAPLSRFGSGIGLGEWRLVAVAEDAERCRLPFHIQWQDLKDLFRQAGAVTRADVALGADGRSRGFGTVSFSNEQDAERAVRMFNGYVVHVRPRTSCEHASQAS
ncbi:RNA-binding domain-containing protein [Daedalea quercina L-15889]|uniref:RNA-binding domain-containing protein n=1 Tax=Daedalea quercina L-15889 TaxID=1314783 RepID=A0A165Q9V3_9APHY|nr:RNA-binding domain-containing protein [Daedalea quercina L-15889]